MNILVCISNVPDTTSKINFTDSDSKFDKSGVQFIINPNDEFGLTKAVWMKESNNASVTVLTVGDAMLLQRLYLENVLQLELIKLLELTVKL